MDSQGERERPTVIFVDDHNVFLDGLQLVIEHDGRLKMVGRASNSLTALELVQHLKPDVVSLDVDLDDVPVEATIRRMRRASPESRLAILSMHSSAVLQHALRRAGACAYISKSMSGFGVVDALLAAATEEIGPLDSPTHGKGADLLTFREREVIRLASLALSNKEIAERLSIALGTVKRHASSAYAKLDASSRVDAARKAQLYGLL